MSCRLKEDRLLTVLQGLAVLTVLKAGFLGSGRFGSGIVVARLADGSWSAPSAIATAGGGFGGQIGFELTDFVFILNDANAVRSFSQAASVTLGGNVSIAAGPVGRNAEAAGAASLKGVAGIFAYSKTKGLFAGVSLEGSVLIERRDANEKLYNGRVTAKQLLEGALRPPPAADPLMRVLNTRVFSGTAFNDGMYNDVPIYDDQHDDLVWEGRTGQAYGANARTNRSSTVNSRDEAYEYRDNPRRANTWADDVYDRFPGGNNSGPTTPTTRTNNGSNDFDTYLNNRSRSSTLQSYSDSKPTRPTAPKPVFRQRTGSLGPNQAVALFTFDPDQDGDLGFKKGDIITITKRTDNKTDWWTGRTADGRTGVFPSNYVETAS
jgi:lipid-binding SYLF domain-containing protein